MYSGYGITFDSVGSWSFDNYVAKNAIILGADNSLLSHDDNHKNNFLVKVQLMEIMEDLVHQRQNLVLILFFFVSVYIIKLIIVICL